MTTPNFSLCPFPVFRAFDANGEPLAGGLLHTYAAGGSTPLATYTDSTGGTANANPVVLDSTGTANVWLGNAPYKLVLTDSTGSNTYFTIDNIYNGVTVNYGASVISSGSNVALTNPMFTLYDVTMTASGKTLTLPAANLTNSIPLGVPIWFHNAGSYSFVIYAQDGSTLLATVPAGATYGLILNSASTANGTWDVAPVQPPTTYGSDQGLNSNGAIVNIETLNSINAATYSIAEGNRGEIAVSAQNCVYAANPSTLGAGFKFAIASGGGFIATFTPTSGIVTNDLNASLSTISWTGAGLAVAYFECDGTNFHMTSGSPIAFGAARPPVRALNNLKITTTGGNTVNITATELVLHDSANGDTVKLTSVSCSYATGNSGAGGLMNGANSQGTSTWLSDVIIYNPSTGVIAAIGCPQSSGYSSPVAGYNYFVVLGPTRVNSSGNLVGKVQNDKDWQYVVGNNLAALPTIASGSSGDPTVPTWIAESVSAAVGSNTAEIKLVLSAPSGSGIAAVAPNASYGASSSSSNPPPLVIYSTTNSGNIELMLESSSVYYASNSSSAILQVLGGRET
jgi:hypothetical protein